jgi:hypothetical protein
MIIQGKAAILRSWSFMNFNDIYSIIYLEECIWYLNRHCFEISVIIPRVEKQNFEI